MSAKGSMSSSSKCDGPGLVASPTLLALCALQPLHRACTLHPWVVLPFVIDAPTCCAHIPTMTPQISHLMAMSVLRLEPCAVFLGRFVLSLLFCFPDSRVHISLCLSLLDLLSTHSCLVHLLASSLLTGHLFFDLLPLFLFPPVIFLLLLHLLFSFRSHRRDLFIVFLFTVTRLRARRLGFLFLP